MKKLFIVLGLLLFITGSVSAGTVSKDCGSAISCSVVVPTVSVGDLVVVTVRVGAKPPLISVAGFLSAGHVDSTDPHRLEMFYQYATVAGSINVSVSAPGGSSMRITGTTFTGPWDTTIVPSFISSSGNSGVATSGVCPASASLCVGAVSTGNAQTAVGVAGETLITSAGNKIFMFSGASASQATFASDFWAAVVATFTKGTIPLPLPISVSVTPLSAIVNTNGLQTFTATLVNDTLNAGVTWTQTGVGSTLALSTTTASFVAPNISGTAIITAASVTDPTKTSTAMVTVVVPPDTTAPIVSIVSPGAEQTISGVLNITVSATDNVGVASVQVLLDGVAFGAPLTVSPYIISLDTATILAGTHSISATAVDTAGNIGTASTVSTTVGGELFDITLVYDDGTSYNAGGTVVFSEVLPGIIPTTFQSDVSPVISATGNIKFRWVAVPTTTYIVIVLDPTGLVTLWNTGTELTPAQVPVAFKGLTTTIVFSKLTGFWAGFSKFTINY